MQEIERKNKQVKLLMDQLRDLITDVAMWQSPCSVWGAKLETVAGRLVKAYCACWVTDHLEGRNGWDMTGLHEKHI